MWTSNRMIALYIAIGVVGTSVVGWFMLRKTIRTRLRMKRIVREDPDIHDWLIAFNWSQKILYIPTIAASLLAALLMLLHNAGWIFEYINPKVVGGIWFGIVFLNLLVEEYNMSVKVLIIVLVSSGFSLLWLHLLGWVVPFWKLFGHLAVTVSSMGFLLVALIGLMIIFISWLKGLFYYVTMTPNYMNMQQGPTESGGHIGREDYNTIVDTTDFLERLMGFGRIVIIFKDMKRQPLVLLVWQIQKKAQMLERVRGKFAIDLNSQQAEQMNQSKE